MKDLFNLNYNSELMENKEIKKKVCLLGSYGVGKTSLVHRFVYNKFEEKYLSTIGVHISKKSVVLDSKDDKQFVELFIWDIANIEKFDSVVNNYLRGAHGAIIVTDITRPNTIENIDEFVDKFMGINPLAKVILVGNKYDMVKEVNFNKDEFVNKNSNTNGNLIFTSAKTGDNVEELFIKLAEKIIGDK